MKYNLLYVLYFSDVVKYLVTILDNESLSNRAKQRGQQLLDKISLRNEELSPTENFLRFSIRPSSQYMDMNEGCSKGECFAKKL